MLPSILKLIFVTSFICSYVGATSIARPSTCSRPCPGGPHDRCRICPSNCPPTCMTLNNPVFCTQECRGSGCQCDPGYVRAPNGQCVLPDQCPATVEFPKCPVCTGGPHDKCVSCASNCPRTCEQPEGPQACILSCRLNACECEAGYVRAKNGQCVLPYQCPSNISTGLVPQTTPTAVGQPNVPEYFKCPVCTGGRHDKCVACASSCPRTCEQPEGPQVCVLACKLNACECEAGYVRAKNGQCIRPYHCNPSISTEIFPPTNPTAVKEPNVFEYFKCPVCTGGRHDKCFSCPSPCPKTCKQPNGPAVCPAYCVLRGCACEPGYVRDDNGQCILPSQCPVENQNTVESNTEAPSTSVTPQPPVLYSCYNRRCPGGLYDRCRQCASRCPLTCDNPEPQTCTKDCAVDVCECAPGYVRARSGHCVLPQNCPQKITKYDAQY